MSCIIQDEEILDLIWMARRYCDGRKTYAPGLFNQIYKKIIFSNPHIKALDKKDDAIESFPLAQDGLFGVYELSLPGKKEEPKKP